MSRLPRISVVMPSFNQEKYLEDAILSVVGQGYPDLELLVMDGGSSDGSVEIIRQYEDRITYWQSQPDKGQGDAINQGFRRATGKIFCWLNSDDLFVPGALRAVGRHFAADPDSPRLLHGAWVRLDESGAVPKGIVEGSGPITAEELKSRDGILQSSSFWTHTLWQAAGELDEQYNYCLDWEWYMRASQKGGLAYLPRIFSIYRDYAETKTASGGTERRQEIAGLVMRYEPIYWGPIYAAAVEQWDTISRRWHWLRNHHLPLRIMPWLCPSLVRLLRCQKDIFPVLQMLE